eukprot:TRINITY_DN31117_c0_g1_i2.p1 TRINITY_DN31117_c0_g1~~TRINITY_DN31117_c0_g1_i2.p1  ORF type:complete len:300 (+),score=111.02 TRINITY_DN31117_c0_g1_i2:48-947(+)
MLSSAALKWRRLSRWEKKIAIVLCLAAALLLFIGPDALKGLAGTNDNTTWQQKEVLRRLRRSLAENMDEFIGSGTGSTFLPKGKVPRVTGMDAVGYNDHVMSSEPFLLSSPDYNCTKSKWDLGFIERKAGDDIVGIETSKSNRFYSNEGLKKVRMTVREFLRDFRSPDRPYDMYLAEENVKQFPGLEADVSYPMFTDSSNLDKVQVWIGAGGQVSPLHHDQWDNVLCQMQGQRRITLYDPFQTDLLYPKTGVNRHFAQVDPANPDSQTYQRTGFWNTQGGGPAGWAGVVASQSHPMTSP